MTHLTNVGEGRIRRLAQGLLTLLFCTQNLMKEAEYSLNTNRSLVNKKHCVE